MQDARNHPPAIEPPCAGLVLAQVRFDHRLGIVYTQSNERDIVNRSPAAAEALSINRLTQFQEDDWDSTPNWPPILWMASRRLSLAAELELIS